MGIPKITQVQKLTKDEKGNDVAEVAIRIEDGDFQDIIYKYGKCQLANMENENGEMPFRFEYEVFDNPNKADIDSKEFISTIGDILLQLLERSLVSKEE